jgi:hypothetical protein
MLRAMNRAPTAGPVDHDPELAARDTAADSHRTRTEDDPRCPRERAISRCPDERPVRQACWRTASRRSRLTRSISPVRASSRLRSSGVRRRPVVAQMTERRSRVRARCCASSAQESGSPAVRTHRVVARVRSPSWDRHPTAASLLRCKRYATHRAKAPRTGELRVTRDRISRVSAPTRSRTARRLPVRSPPES